MKPIYDPDNWDHAVIEAHASCNGGCGCQAGFARCEDDPEFRELHGLTDDRPVTLDHLESIMGRIRRAAGIQSPAKGSEKPVEESPLGHSSAGSLVSPGQTLHDEHRGFDRCPGSDVLVPLGTPYDTIYVCTCGAGVRLYHDGINYRMREHERYQSAPLPSHTAVIR